MLFDIELFRTWCLQLSETVMKVSKQEEYYKIHDKTFAVINSNGIRLKCTPEDFELATQNPDIIPSAKYASSYWIQIIDFKHLSIEDFHEFIINSYEIVVKSLPGKIQKKLLKNLNHEIDSPWKDVIGLLFKDFMMFFAPEIASDIDWNKSPIFMDKELSKIMQGAKSGKRFVDKLVQVFKCSGEERLVLFHIEVQGQKQSIFPERLYQYSNRLEDMYNALVASFAILADEDFKWRPTSYQREIWGTRKYFEFPMVKLLDYRDQWDKLERSDNPFAIVVMAHLKMLETRNDFEKRLHWKIELTKMLYAKGYSVEKVYALFKFIDWIMLLPRQLVSCPRIPYLKNLQFKIPYFSI
jgi:predicted DNA-binding protein (MmcQ/YjbR family)